MSDRIVSGMRFGIYPGGAAGDADGSMASGPANDPARVSDALLDLQGKPRRPFHIRAYDIFTEHGPPTWASGFTAAAASPQLGDERQLELVAQYQSPTGDVDGYARFVEALIVEHGHHTDFVQICEEPNVDDNPVLDGFYPRIKDAVIEGVAAAKRTITRLHLHHLKVGINTTPLFGPAPDWLTELTSYAGNDLVRDLDWIGLDFFPDVFAPIDPSALGDAVQGLIRHHRHETLTTAGLGHLPLRITEN